MHRKRKNEVNAVNPVHIANTENHKEGKKLFRLLIFIVVSNATKTYLVQFLINVFKFDFKINTSKWIVPIV
jgi:hypothetical protein